MKALLPRTLGIVSLWAFGWAAMAQIAVLHLKVLEGEGAVHPAGAHVSHPIIVEVTDDAGRPVAGAAVSFQLPPDGPGGLFSNGLRTDLAMTDSSGHATLHSMQLNRTAGSFRIRITAVKEQARAGIVSVQYIGEAGGVQEAKSGAAPAQTASATQHSAGITPNNSKMSSGSHKKWIILGVLAAAGGAAFAGVSRASKSSSSPSSSSVSIGTPTINVGSPNP
jgi:hypothetical protein